MLKSLGLKKLGLKKKEGIRKVLKIVGLKKRL